MTLPLYYVIFPKQAFCLVIFYLSNIAKEKKKLFKKSAVRGWLDFLCFLVIYTEHRAEAAYKVQI